MESMKSTENWEDGSGRREGKGQLMPFHYNFNRRSFKSAPLKEQK